jgi:hypothetical protein
MRVCAALSFFMWLMAAVKACSQRFARPRAFLYIFSLWYNSLLLVVFSTCFVAIILFKLRSAHSSIVVTTIYLILLLLLSILLSSGIIVFFPFSSHRLAGK